MKKALVLMMGLFVSTAINVWATAPLLIYNINVTGATNPTGNITVSADLGYPTFGPSVDTTYQVCFQATSTNELSRRYFPPDTVATGNSWSNSSWNPYFTGTFILDITAWDNSGGSAIASTTVTVTRATSGTINSLKYSSAPYNADGVWSNINTTKVKLHDIGLNLDILGVGSLGCNLLNVTNITEQMSEEQRDIAYTDTVGYKPAGTPYRFDVNLHARPRGFMGMGEIKRWIWAPTDTNIPDGPGRLEVDITTCSPWRSSYSNALQSHVGFAPLFAPSAAGVLAGPSDMPTGMIQCTSAHYMDVGPTNTGSQTDARCGLLVNGHTDTNSYLKTFLSDTLLQQQFGLTNVYDATNVMAGFVQHFGASTDSVAQVAASFTRIVGGTGTNLVYDYNFDGIGDSGYEARLTFTFQSAVAAQMGMAASTNLPSAPTGLSVSKGTYSDKIRLTWNAVANATSYEGWYNTVNDSSSATKSGSEITSTTGDDTGVPPGVVYYYWIKAKNAAGTSGFSSSDYGYIIAPVTGDIDGDGKADLISVVSSNWYVWFSSSGYLQRTGPVNLGISGTPATGDIDGDGKADLICVPEHHHAVGSNWYVWFSSSGYTQRAGPIDLGISGRPATGDIDGDGKDDLIVVPERHGEVGSNWYVWLSSSGYTQRIGPVDLGISGTPTTGDIDGGDGLADLVSVVGSNWYLWFSSLGYAQRIGPCDLGISGLPVTGDLDGDGLSDLISVVNGTNWYVWFSTLHYLTRNGPYTLSLP